MRHYASIPFGGRNITNDIKTELQISERLAENIKLAFGACMPDKLQSLSEKVLHIDGLTADQSKEVTVKYLSEIITARVEEIIQAMLYEISQSGLAEHLRGGIVVTGGVSQTANLGILIRQMSGYNVRIGRPLGSLSCQDVDGIYEPSASTSIGLIQAAIEDDCMNCATCEETYHTEVENPVEVETVAVEPEVAEPVAVVEETTYEVIEETTPVYEIEDEELVVESDEEEDYEEEDTVVEEVEDEDYDEELEDEDDDDSGKKKKKKSENTGGLMAKIKFIWNKINDDTDDMIDDMTKK
jgi:cell division protein FtsA